MTFLYSMIKLSIKLPRKTIFRITIVSLKNLADKTNPPSFNPLKQYSNIVSTLTSGLPASTTTTIITTTTR